MTPSQVALKLFLDEIGVPLEVDTFAKRLLIQKKTYLSQLTGFDLRYRFAWYVHGPYSRQLTYDVFRLKEEAAEVEREYEGQTLNPLAKKLVATATTFWANKPTTVSESDWLELLASLHYVRHIAYNARGTPRDFADAFQTVVACKPKFVGREPDAQATWDQLQRLGLITNKVLPVPAEAEQGK
jgi:uncharacterized protein YwgA